MGRINLEPSQTTASKHWPPHRIPTSVWAGFGSSVVIITYFSFLPRRPSTTRSILVQQYSSNTHVEPWEHVLKIALLDITRTPRVFRRNQFARHPPSCSRGLQAPSPVFRGTRIRSRYVSRSFRLSTRCQRSSLQVFSQRHNTQIRYVMHA